MSEISVMPFWLALFHTDKFSFPRVVFISPWLTKPCLVLVRASSYYTASSVNRVWQLHRLCVCVCVCCVKSSFHWLFCFLVVRRLVLDFYFGHKSPPSCYKLCDSTPENGVAVLSMGTELGSVTNTIWISSELGIIVFLKMAPCALLLRNCVSWLALRT